jgi:hypothetical protein
MQYNTAQPHPDQALYHQVPGIGLKKELNVNGIPGGLQSMPQGLDNYFTEGDPARHPGQGPSRVNNTLH